MLTYEKQILGAVIAGTIKPSAVPLGIADFTDTELAQMLNLARRMEENGQPIDAEAMYSATVETEVGFYTAYDFKEWAASANSAAAAYSAIEKIKSQALKKYLSDAITQIALDPDRTGAEMLNTLKRISATSEKFYQSSQNNFVSLKDLKPQVKAVYQDLHSGISYALPTYFIRRDEMLLDGYSKGDLHLIVGQTGAGKSSLALNDALNQAKQGHVIGVVSREMSAIENVMRLQASDAKIPRWKIRKDMWDSTYAELNEHLDSFTDLPMYFDTQTEDIENLRPQAIEMVEKNGMAALYVDYLQLMGAKSNSDTRANEVQAISRELKKLAMELGIPIIALCQFNNGVINASLFDVMNYIRESGSIKQDASTIQYIQVEHTEEQKEWKDAKVTVLKNRNGATFASVDLRFNGAEFRFEEL